MSFRYLAFTLLFDRLENFLNELEHEHSGSYDIVSIFERQKVGERAVMGIVIKLYINVGFEFNEEEIKRRLGF